MSWLVGLPASSVLLVSISALGPSLVAAPPSPEEERVERAQPRRSAAGAALPRLVPMAGDRVLEARPLRALRPDVVAHILNGRDGGAIGLEGYATIVPPAAEAAEGAKHTRVLLVVEIDGPSFLETNVASGLTRVELYAYALLGDRRVAAFLAQTVFVDVGELQEEIHDSGLRFVGHIELPRGHYDLRIMVRNFHGRASGLRTFPLEVPDPALRLRVAGR
jgi:hypothetical protein